MSNLNGARKKYFFNLPSTPQLRNAFYFTGQYLPMVEIMIDGQIICLNQLFGDSFYLLD